jgi:phage gp29-like protein
MSIWSTIRSAFGGPTPASLSGGSVLPDQSLWGQLSQFYGDFSPERISQIIRQADQGNIKRLVDLAQTFRSRDGHIHGCFTGLELAVTKLDWHAQAVAAGFRGKTRKADIKLCAQVEAAVDQLDGWGSALAHLVGSSELHGHATVELNGWRLYEGKNPLLRGWLLPSYVSIVQTNRFGFRQSDGKLLFDSLGYGDVNSGGIDLLDAYPAGKFIQCTPRITGAVPVQEGLSRLVVWHGGFRNWATKDYLLAAEGSWKPTRVITYKKGSSESADKALALSLAERLISSGGAAIPDSLAVEVFFPKNGASGQQAPHKVLAEYLGAELSKATLGHTLLLESGDRGARSLGDIGFQVATERRDARANSLAIAVNAMFIRPLVAMNVSNAPAPLYLPDTDSSLDMQQFASSVDTLAKRMRIPSSWVRETASIPEPRAGEEILIMGAKPVDPSTPLPASPNAPSKPDDSAEEELDIPVTIEDDTED